MTTFIKNSRINIWLAFVLLTIAIFSTPSYSQMDNRALLSSDKDGVDILHTNVLVDPTENKTIHKAIRLFQNDVYAVAGYHLKVQDIPSGKKSIIIVGTTTNSKYIRELVGNNKLKVRKIQGQWENYEIAVVDHPFKNIKRALVVVGSDRRGTAYGLLHLSRLIGVSPWNWWADVPVMHQSHCFVGNNILFTDGPKVQYRGIFLNDEEPALGNWAREKFGGLNHHFYAKVFELMLRLKANYLWPAMWGKSFFNDDTTNFATADSFGIVIGTSHHEPLMRAQADWHRFGSGKWDYNTNKKVLNDFWKKGMEIANPYDKIVTIGMRGDGDEPMTEGAAVSLLERIVKDQRNIIADVTKKPAYQTPQLWALYKEVQEYYDKGMRVPDDVTLLLCDDNWGNVRRLPDLSDSVRKGGYGMYYHFDYVGDPRNYKWINTNNISRVWEQMHLAYEYNVKKIWIVNVGDLKPMEYPVSFFLDYAWNPEKINENDLRSYAVHWSSEQFGSQFASDIADLLEKYTRYNARRKPELLNEKTYSLDHYQEFARVTGEYLTLKRKARQLESVLSPEMRNAYYQLVLHPIEAMSNLYQMYFYTALNHQAYEDWNLWSNSYADSVKMFYAKDSLISANYNHLNNGKWNHFMDQTHIGYTYWQQPDFNSMPVLQYRPGGEPYKGKAIQPLSLLIEAHSKIQHPNFVEKDGYISIDAAHFTSNKRVKNAEWKKIPGIGRNSDGVTLFPVTATFNQNSKDAPMLNYVFEAEVRDSVNIYTYFSPTLNFLHKPDGLQVAISLDDTPKTIVSINKNENNHFDWQQWVSNNIIIKHTKIKPGNDKMHILKITAIDPGVVLQKIVIDCGGFKSSYLEPEETTKL